MKLRNRQRYIRLSHFTVPLALLQIFISLAYVFASWAGQYHLKATDVDNGPIPIFATTNGDFYITNYMVINPSMTNPVVFTIAPDDQLYDVQWTFGGVPATNTPTPYSAEVYLTNFLTFTNLVPVTITSTRTNNGVGCTTAYQPVVMLLPLQLDQVTYSDTETAPKGQFDVYDDATAIKFSSEHGSNQWQEPNPGSTNALDQTGWQDPICYSSGSTMTAAVQFKVPAGSMWSSFTNMKIKGVGVADSGHPDDSTGYNFTNTDGKGFAATYSSSSSAIIAAGMTCSQAFPSSAVGYIKPLTIQWYFSVDGGNTWALVNQSKNECFVTLTAPNLTPTVNTDGTPGGTTGADSNYKLFQTVLYYACSDPGATSNDTAVANTWSLFTSGGTGPANICAWNPTDKSYDRKLYYYGASRGFGGSQPVTTTALLAASDGDGECYSFGQLFEDALWANGITNNGIYITAINGNSFLVKDFTPSATGSMPGSAAPYLWKMTFSASPGEMQPPPVATGFGVYGDFVNLSTHKGQNTAPPLEKVFGNHYIVQYGSSYYDPSYGVTYTSANNFESSSVLDYAQGITGDAVDLEAEPASGLHNIQFQSLTIPHQ